MSPPKTLSLVPKFHLGTPLVLREISFRADTNGYLRVTVGNEIASASVFPNEIWEQGTR
jgi:hypothetical protein